MNLHVSVLVGWSAAPRRSVPVIISEKGRQEVTCFYRSTCPEMHYYSYLQLLQSANEWDKGGEVSRAAAPL